MKLPGGARVDLSPFDDLQRLLYRITPPLKVVLLGVDPMMIWGCCLSFLIDVLHTALSNLLLLAVLLYQLENFGPLTFYGTFYARLLFNVSIDESIVIDDPLTLAASITVVINLYPVMTFNYFARFWVPLL